MLCKQCGEDLQETDLFCPKCGLEKNSTLDLAKEKRENFILGLASVVGLINTGILSTPMDDIFSRYGIYLLIRFIIVFSIVYYPLKWILHWIAISKEQKGNR